MTEVVLACIALTAVFVYLGTRSVYMRQVNYWHSEYIRMYHKFNNEEARRTGTGGWGDDDAG